MGASLSGCDTCCSRSAADAAVSRESGGPATEVPFGREPFEEVRQERVPANKSDLSTVVGSLVFVEHCCQEGQHPCDAAASTSPSSRRPSSSTKGGSVSSKLIKYKGMAMLQTVGTGCLSVPPGKLDQVKLEIFRSRLRNSGLVTSEWGINGAKSVEHLFWEAYQQRGCILIGSGEGGRMKRITRIVKIRLAADIFGMEHILCSRMQFMHDGQTVERMQVPLRKLIWLQAAGEGGDIADPRDESLYAESSAYTEDWRAGCRKVLEERLGLAERWQAAHLAEVTGSHTFHTEDDVTSTGYPGLNTLYCIHTVTFRVIDPEHTAVQCIGLPVGQEFATQEGDFDFNSSQHEEGLPIGSQLNIWTWRREDGSLLGQPTRGSRAKEPQVPAANSAGQATVAVPSPDGRSAALNMGLEGSMSVIRRVPLFDSSVQDMVGMKASMTLRIHKPPCGLLWSLMDGLTTDWPRAKRIAKSISDPKYSLKQYYDDLMAFPEMRLYLMEDATRGHISSGRTVGDEYQRTVCAFFAIYWLFRLDIDGKDGFCYGVDDDWRVLSAASEGDPRTVPLQKRTTFHRGADWDYFSKLLKNAGLIKEEKRSGSSWGRSSGTQGPSSMKVCERRLVSLLALTAVHDIMKMAVILPEVQGKHSPYRGYQAGDTIGDHDHALGYIMDYYQELLPSFKGLDTEERRAVQFTQCKLCFNHGWFVQGEAPPGCIFTSFKEALVRDHKSLMGQSDVALYFVHWLTDLAGAEPTPLAGCEKFAVKFPLPVLNSFLRSFEFVEKIATQTETEVNEQYLKMRWVEHVPSLGPSPKGDDAIAKMRLLCMAQANSIAVLEDFSLLSEDDREVLATEMSRTACLGQSYSADLVPREVRDRPQGPAFLIYYGPAFLQNLNGDKAVKRLAMLAEVYRCARELWAATVSKVAVGVTVRIDVIKALTAKEIVDAVKEGDCWVLVKHNESEAFVERSSKKRLNKMIAQSQGIQILDTSFLGATEEP